MLKVPKTRSIGPSSRVRSRTRSLKRHHVATGALYLGIDYGTSGARCTVIDEDENIIEEYRATYDASQGGASSPEAWVCALGFLLSQIDVDLKLDIASIAIDGTSSTALMVNGDGKPVSSAKMYNEAQDRKYLDMVSRVAPQDHTVCSSTSTLAKAYAFLDAIEGNIDDGYTMLHQADYVAFQLHRCMGHSDWNNCLKVGYCPQTEEYPEWLTSAEEVFKVLPKIIHPPGEPVGQIHPEAASLYGLSNSCTVVSGTTDSIAAFLASGVSSPGQAVTSLGSTLAIKLLSEYPVNDARYGVYSHRLGQSWLVGGASNSGGIVLRQYFTDEELAQLTSMIDINTPTGLKYVVLPSKGERFPDNDPNMLPNLEPRPAEKHIFLQGILENLSSTESRAYALLSDLGATPVKEIHTCGGGAKNPVWTALRSRMIGVPVIECANGEASFGAAILARRGLHGCV